MKLYHHPMSGHSHRARLFLSLLDVPHELILVDLSKGAHKAPDFLKLNPFGQVPVLDDDGTIVTDSVAILVYLAKKLRRSDWLPEEPLAAAKVQKWLSVAAGEIAYGPAAARLITVFGASFRAGGSADARPQRAEADRCRAGATGLYCGKHPDRRRCGALQLHRERAGRECRSFRLCPCACLAGADRSSSRLRRIPENARSVWRRKDRTGTGWEAQPSRVTLSRKVRR